ncbi:MAG: hypothetical protein WBD51_15770, partial [Burkholderiaceae bacterium]
MQAEQTKLRDVANDGENMYLDFAINVPQGMEFFDGEGAPIKAMIDGGLVGVPGVHSSLLIRLDKSMSFVSVRRGLKAEDAPRVVESLEIKRMRERLVAEEPAKAAMLNVLSKIAKRSDIPVATADFKDRALAVQNEALPGEGFAPGGSILSITLPPDVNVPVDYASIDWRADPPPGVARSALKNNSLGQKAYITFVGDTLQPVAASDVIGAVRWAANKERGIILVSGMTGAGADAAAVLRAQQRAELVRKILVDEGVPKSKTSITAVFQTDTHRKA